MGWYLLTVYLHILATVFWIGYLLFWTIILGALTKNPDVPEPNRLLHQINQASWPPEGIATPFRLKFPGLGWVTLLVLAVTGSFMLGFQHIPRQQILSGEFFLSSYGQTLALKLILVVGLLVFHLLLTNRPALRPIYLSMGTALVIVILSVLLTH